MAQRAQRLLLKHEFLWQIEHQRYKNTEIETFLVVQWLRLYAPNAGGPGSIPGQETRSHMPQLKIMQAAAKMEDPWAATKTQHSQISK